MGTRETRIEPVLQIIRGDRARCQKRNNRTEETDWRVSRSWVSENRTVIHYNQTDCPYTLLNSCAVVLSSERVIQEVFGKKMLEEKPNIAAHDRFAA